LQAWANTVGPSQSGKRNDRPELAAALAACKKHKVKLIIAKLDRLSRNLAFIAKLMDSGVELGNPKLAEARKQDVMRPTCFR
jgi:DNA invertase Pin-like site-specific DNA recombinase